MTLGQVVLSLSDASSSNKKCQQQQQQQPQHIPYRDSKLTRLLQPSLSGNAQMLLLCCISPLASHLEESHNTFKFATRAKRIEQKATIQTAQGKDETLLHTYRDEIEDLKQQLREAKEQKRLLEELQQQQQYHVQQEQAAAAGIDMEAMESATGEIKELVDAIQNMEKLILKSRPSQKNSAVGGDGGAGPKTELDKTLASILQSDDSDEDGSEELLIDDDRLKGSPNASIAKDDSKDSTEDQLHCELTRIRGLLGSVLQKRGVRTVPSPDRDDVRKNLDFSTPQKMLDRSLSDEMDDAMEVPFDEIHDEEKKTEVETLRKQLEQQERTTNLRKADSSFLQSQLAEKDKLLEEVSNLLEAVEQRQAQLERENDALKREIHALKMNVKMN
jgi:centromeric protein E